MTTNHTIESIKKSHKPGMGGVFDIVSYLEILKTKTNKWAFAISIAISMITWLLGIKSEIIIKEVVTALINFLPGILGFTIAGFTLMVGFLQSDLIDSITEKSKDSDFTLYQRTVSHFAVCVLLQSFALIIGYAFHFIMIYDKNKGFDISCSFIEYVNGFALVVIWYAFILSVFLVCQVVVNIFNFSQLHHFVIVKKKIENTKTDKTDA